MKEPIDNVQTLNNNTIQENNYAQENQTKKQSKVQKFSYTRDNQNTALSILYTPFDLEELSAVIMSPSNPMSAAFKIKD